MSSPKLKASKAASKGSWLSWKSEVPPNIVAAALQVRFLGERVLTNGGSISTGGFVKIPL